MSTIGVFDYDFFTYENVIPNLECAKILTYNRQHNNITVLTPTLNPNPYTEYVVRKDYDDGIFPKELFLPNCSYGGRAFNPNEYAPLPPAIERTVPDMHIYDRYISNFGQLKTEQDTLKRILNCAHMRLAPDSHNLLSITELNKYIKDKTTGIFLHDYDLASLKPYDLLKQLQDSRMYKSREEINPYPIGNKFPIVIDSSAELEKWLQLVAIPNGFLIEYRGLMDDTTAYKLCMENSRIARQVFYNVASGCSGENDFFMNRLPKIFIQSLFFRKCGIKILLKYDEGFFITKELEQLIKLLNCYISTKWQENFLPLKQTLYTLCRDAVRFQYTDWKFHSITLTIDEIRNIFQYIRLKNYDLFKMFYEWDSVILQGGKFVNEWA